VRVQPRTVQERTGGAALGAAPNIAPAAHAFERVLDLALAGIAPHLRLKRLGVEIRRTTRRINALNEGVLPMLFRQVRDIRLALDERDREELIRAKRFRVRESAGGGSDHQETRP